MIRYDSKMPSGAAIAVFLLVSLSACSTTNNRTEITFQESPKMGVLIKDIEVSPFASGGRFSTGPSVQLTNTVMAELAQQQYVAVSENSSYTLEGQVVAAPFTHENSQTDNYKIKKVNGKPKLVKDGVLCVVEKKSNLSGSFSVIDSSGGSIGGDSFSVSIQDKGTDESCGGARAELATDAELMHQAIKSVSADIVRYISPHNVTRTVEFKTGGSDDNLLGVGFFQDGLMDEAVYIWEQVSVKPLDSDVRAAAFYNMGIAHESVGNLSDAHENYQQAARMNPREKQFRQALSRVVKQQKNKDSL